MTFCCKNNIFEISFKEHFALYIQKGLVFGMILFILLKFTIYIKFFDGYFCVLQEITSVPESKSTRIQFATSPDPDINKKSINSTNNISSKPASDWDFWTIVKWVAVGIGILGAFAGVVYCIRNGMPDFDFGKGGGGNPTSSPPPPPSTTTSTNNGINTVATAVVETVTPEITAAAQAVGETAAKAVQAAVEVAAPITEPVIPPAAEVIQEVVVQAVIEVAAAPMAPPGAEVVREVVAQGAEAVMQRAEVIQEAARRVPPQPAAPAIGGNGDPLRGGYLNQSNVEAILNTVIIQTPTELHNLTPRHYGSFAEYIITRDALALIANHPLPSPRDTICLKNFTKKMDQLRLEGKLSREYIDQLRWGKKYFNSVQKLSEMQKSSPLSPEIKKQLVQQIRLVRAEKPANIHPFK